MKSIQVFIFVMVLFPCLLSAQGILRNSNGNLLTTPDGTLLKAPLKIPCGTLIIRDLDGNLYQTDSIGTQCWMKENLRTTKYNDGTAIPNVTDNTDWSNLTTSGFSWYNNDANTYKTYGGYYNWYAVDNNPSSKMASNGGKNICPTGWHVPSHDQWIILESYLIANGYNYDGSTSGNKIAKALASSNWTGASVNTQGAPGNNTAPTYINKSGFTAEPYDNRSSVIPPIHMNANFWSSSEHYSSYVDNGWPVVINTGGPYLISDQARLKKEGFSVRCLRDN